MNPYVTELMINLNQLFTIYQQQEDIVNDESDGEQTFSKELMNPFFDSVTTFDHSNHPEI